MSEPEQHAGHSILGRPLPDRPCRWCTHYGGPAWGDPSVAWCNNDRRHVVALPERGCAFFLRLTGVDDDLSERDAAQGLP